MPQLSKGGKYVFGWTKIKRNGEIIIPEEIVKEYGLNLEKNLILITGSNLSSVFAARGPIVEKARRYPNVKIFGQI